MNKVKVINNKREIVKVPKSYKGDLEHLMFEGRYDLHIKYGFYTIIEPTLLENEEIDYDLENGTINTVIGEFTYAKKVTPLKTNTEKYSEDINNGIDKYLKRIEYSKIIVSKINSMIDLNNISETSKLYELLTELMIKLMIGRFEDANEIINSFEDKKDVGKIIETIGVDISTYLL